MTGTRTLAKRVALGDGGVTVDDLALPFHVGEDVTLVRASGQVVGVTVTILCEEVLIGAVSHGTLRIEEQAA